MTASGDGGVQAIFLGGKSRGSVAFGNPRFSGGKSYYAQIKASLAKRFVLVLKV